MADNIIKTPRRVAHFSDPKLERQFEEIINFQSQAKRRIESTQETVEKIDPDIGQDQPSTPTGLVIHSAFKKFIFNWNRLTSDNIAGYIVSYSSSFDNQSTWNEWINIDVGSASFYIHDNLDPAYDYRYRVASYNRQNVRSAWTEIKIAGKPGKVSLSEEITGELIGDYLADGSIDPPHLGTELYEEREAWNSTVTKAQNTENELNKDNDKTSFTSITQNYNEITSVATTADDNKAYISAIGQTPEEISSTVSEVYPNGTANASTIQQNSDAINLRVVALDSEGNPTDVNAQLNVSQVDGNGFIYIGGDQITLDGNTNIDGDFALSGNAIINKSILAEKYKEVRNVLPYNYLDSLDNTNGLICDFYIPSETVNIVKILLTAKGLPFRAYSTGAKDGGAVTRTSTWGGEHSHDTEDIQTDYADDHNHSLDASSSSTSSESGAGLSTSTGSTGTYGCDSCLVDHAHSYIPPENHSHGYTEITGMNQAGRHNHNVYNYNVYADGEHTHNVSIPDHIHDLLFGIYEDTLPADVTLDIDNGSGFNNSISLGSSEILAEELDLSQHFTGTGWKRIRFNSSQRGRINAQLVLKVDITA